MKASAILYTSNTGYTRAYARMLGEAAGLPVYDMKKDGPVPGAPVVYLGWLRAGRVVGLKKAARRWKVRACCAVGMAPPGEQEEELGEFMPGIPVYYLRGGYNGKALRGIDRVMMSMMERVIARTARQEHPQTPETTEMLRAVRQGADWVGREQLEPVLAWLKKEKIDH